eukprot:1444218-Rhodomonas_salina.1
MRITCAVARHYEENAGDALPDVFDVGFQIPTTARYMTCAASKINVQSVRWPSTRYTTLDPDVEI